MCAYCDQNGTMTFSVSVSVSTIYLFVLSVKIVIISLLYRDKSHYIKTFSLFIELCAHSCISERISNKQD